MYKCKECGCVFPRPNYKTVREYHPEINMYETFTVSCCPCGSEVVEDGYSECEICGEFFKDNSTHCSICDECKKDVAAMLIETVMTVHGTDEREAEDIISEAWES